jgi:hypothetical protein
VLSVQPDRVFDRKQTSVGVRARVTDLAGGAVQAVGPYALAEDALHTVTRDHSVRLEVARGPGPIRVVVPLRRLDGEADVRRALGCRVDVLRVGDVRRELGLDIRGEHGEQEFQDTAPIR